MFQYKHVKIFLNDCTHGPLFVGILKLIQNLKAFGKGLNNKKMYIFYGCFLTHVNKSFAYAKGLS